MYVGEIHSSTIKDKICQFFFHYENNEKWHLLRILSDKIIIDLNHFTTFLKIESEKIRSIDLAANHPTITLTLQRPTGRRVNLQKRQEIRRRVLSVVIFATRIFCSIWTNCNRNYCSHISLHSHSRYCCKHILRNLLRLRCE